MNGLKPSFIVPFGGGNLVEKYAAIYKYDYLLSEIKATILLNLPDIFKKAPWKMQTL